MSWTPLPAPPVLVAQVSCWQPSNASGTFSFVKEDLFSSQVNCIQAVAARPTVRLKARTPSESGIRLLRIGRKVQWPKDDSDTDY